MSYYFNWERSEYEKRVGEYDRLRRKYENLKALVFVVLFHLGLFVLVDYIYN